MKRIKIRRNHVHIAVVAILLVLIGALAVTTANARARINTLEIDSAVGKSEMAKLKLELQSLKAGNGTSLDQCLDAAAKKFAAKLKTDSELSIVNGQNIYTQSMESYNEANNQLNADRESCNKQYN